MKKTMLLTILAENNRRVGDGLQRLPRGVLGLVITDPFDKKLGSPSPCSVCKDGLDLVLSFAIDNLGFWGRQRAAAEGFRRWNEGSEPIDMEHIVNAHGGR
jgi:hypothetical protein